MSKTNTDDDLRPMTSSHGTDPPKKKKNINRTNSVGSSISGTPPVSTFTTQRTIISRPATRTSSTRSSSANSFLRSRNSAQIPIQQLVLEKKQQQTAANEKVALVLTEKQRKRMRTLAALSQRQSTLHQMEKLSYQKTLDKHPSLQNHRQHVQEVYQYKSFVKEKKYQKMIDLPNIRARLVIDTVEGMYNFSQQLKEREKHSAYPALSETEKYTLNRLASAISEPFLSFLCDNLNTLKDGDDSITLSYGDNTDNTSILLEPSIADNNSDYSTEDEIETIDDKETIDTSSMYEDL